MNLHLKIFVNKKCKGTAYVDADEGMPFDWRNFCVIFNILHEINFYQ